MSEDVQIFGLPEGRVLDDGGQGQKGYVGTIGPLKPCTPELRRALTKHIPEIDADDLIESGKTLLDRTSGVEYRVVTSLVDPSAPGETQVEAFVVRENLVCYLRPIDAGEQVKVIGAASFSGGRA